MRRIEGRLNVRARRAALRAGIGVAAFLCMTNPWLPVAAEPPSESGKIDELIRRVSTRTDLVFERNGMTYSSIEAARHLQVKREFAGDQIRTARDFIDRLGTVSSMTGQEYRVYLASGERLASADFLRAELAAIEAGTRERERAQAPDAARAG
jgi:hypothetical protein